MAQFFSLFLKNKAKLKKSGKFKLVHASLSQPSSRSATITLSHMRAEDPQMCMWDSTIGGWVSGAFKPSSHPEQTLNQCQGPHY